MCGFAGVVAWEDKFRVTRETLARMSAAIAHRGPDGEGLHLNHEQEVTSDHPQVGLVHRRLAILDPDPRANQPFSDQQGRWIVFNGEIYNFRELRGELAKLKPDYAWRTNCDTEVLLVAYDAWGEKCLERLNGMFAFAVWDEPKQELFLARDRMGQKPLYVACVAATGARSFPPSAWGYVSMPLAAVCFASELPALIEASWVDKTPSPLAVATYLQWGFLDQTQSIIGGARLLHPSEYLRFSRSGMRHDHYFSPDLRLGGEEQINELIDSAKRTRALVVQAVRRQLVSDVPFGCFLSGGIDSSIVAAAMREAVPREQPVMTFSIGFDDVRYDERPYASAVAKHLGTQHREFVVRPNAADDLPLLAKAFGEPFGDSSALPTHYLARETRSHVKVTLSGDGGDELFGGYDRYRAMAIGEKLRRRMTPIPWIVLAPLLRELPAGHPKSSRSRLRRFLLSLALPTAQRYASYLRLMDDGFLAQFFPSAEMRGDSIELQYSNERKLHGVVPAALAVDRLIYLPNDLLTKVDRASMLHALEVRSPFMDHELVQFAAGLTTDQLLRGGPKRMLREAFAQDLPAWVFKRKKMGFAVPIGEWFRGELRPMLRDNLFASDSFAASHFNRAVLEKLVDEHEREIVDHSQRLYALLMLELWWKT